MEKMKLALQIYTVRDFVETDIKGTFQKVKAMGYDTIELAGMSMFNGMTPTELKEMLAECGLTAISAHVPIQELDADPQAAVLRYKEAGCRYIAIPWLAMEQCPGGAQFEATLATINTVGKLCNDNGMTLLYHNHDFEFVKMPDGTYGLDYLYQKVPADILQTEIDTCWVKFAGVDPVGYIRKYAGRCPIVHLKDFYKEGETGQVYELIGDDGEEIKEAPPRGVFEFRPLGMGVQDFPAIIKAAEESGAEWIVVEQDTSVGRTSLEAAQLSREYLKTLGY